MDTRTYVLACLVSWQLWHPLNEHECLDPGPFALPHQSYRGLGSGTSGLWPASPPVKSPLKMAWSPKCYGTEMTHQVLGWESTMKLVDWVQPLPNFILCLTKTPLERWIIDQCTSISWKYQCNNSIWLRRLNVAAFFDWTPVQVAGADIRRRYHGAKKQVQRLVAKKGKIICIDLICILFFQTVWNTSGEDLCSMGSTFLVDRPMSISNSLISVDWKGEKTGERHEEKPYWNPHITWYLIFFIGPSSPLFLKKCCFRCHQIMFAICQYFATLCDLLPVFFVNLRMNLSTYFDFPCISVFHFKWDGLALSTLWTIPSAAICHAKFQHNRLWPQLKQHKKLGKPWFFLHNPKNTMFSIEPEEFPGFRSLGYTHKHTHIQWQYTLAFQTLEKSKVHD